MAKIQIEIRDDISPVVAIEAVKQVVANGKMSVGEHGRKYYCWASEFATSYGNIIVGTRQYRKNDCFVVYKRKDNEEDKDKS